MILHGYYRSSASFRVRIGLNLKGLAYESVSHHLRRGEQRAPEYLALNPQGFVPALTDGEQTLVQSLAILEYLDERHPEPPFLPTGPADRAYVRGLAQLVACDIHPLNNLRVLKHLRSDLGQDEAAVKAWYNHWIAAGFAALETRLAGDPRTRTFCFGDRPGLADICLTPQVANARTYELDMSPYPSIRRIDEACMELTAFADAHPTRQVDAE